jgi:hypothetical protein
LEYSYLPFSIALKVKSGNSGAFNDSDMSYMTNSSTGTGASQSRSTLGKSGRVELIATSYETLKQWVVGINHLISNSRGF